MKLNQVYKILKVAFIATLIMFAFEVIFAIPGVTDNISMWVQSINNKWALWLVLWLIMYVQVTIIPIPAYIVLNAAMYAQIINPSNGLIAMFSTWECWLFIIIVLSAYMAGAICAYLIGYKWGRKAVKWCAGSDEDYDKWSNVLNEKGKWWYASTVILPVFPDDLLCIVAGSVKFNFSFFSISNLIGRGIGLICMIGALAIMQSANNGGIPWTLIGWGIATLALLIACIVLHCKLKRNKNDGQV